VASELIIQVYSWMFDNLRHSQNSAATLPYVNYKLSSDNDLHADGFTCNRSIRI
jgi:hypothetical protein